MKDQSDEAVADIKAIFKMFQDFMDPQEATIYLRPDVARECGADVPSDAELVVIHNGELRWL